MDGIDDTFRDVASGTRLTFAARFHNQSILPADYDQVFHLVVRVVGDGDLLNEVSVRVTVPRGRLPEPDAGPTGMDGGTPVDAGELDAGNMTDAGTSDAGDAAMDGA